MRSEELANFIWSFKVMIKVYFDLIGQEYRIRLFALSSSLQRRLLPIAAVLVLCTLLTDVLNVETSQASNDRESRHAYCTMKTRQDMLSPCSARMLATTTLGRDTHYNQLCYQYL
jgi:hypothetical protein